MIRLLMIAALAVTLTGAPTAAETDGAAEARAVIERQLEAFARDDWAGAFAFASPNIQRLFGDPGNFGAMVRSGYPMVWRPAETRFIGAETTPRGLRHTVVFTDAAGVTHVADYFMTRVEGAWRISGVVIRPRVDAGA